MVANGVVGRLRPIRGASFLEDMSDVGRHGVGADEELLRYLLVRQAGGEELEHVELAPTEPTGLPRQLGVIPLTKGHRKAEKRSHAESFRDLECLLQEGRGFLAVPTPIPFQKHRGVVVARPRKLARIGRVSAEAQGFFEKAYRSIRLTERMGHTTEQSTRDEKRCDDRVFHRSEASQIVLDCVQVFLFEGRQRTTHPT